MSGDLFDLGQRMRAHTTRTPVERTAYAHQLPATDALAVEVHPDLATGRPALTVTDARGTHTATGDHPLAALAAADVALTATHRTVVVTTRKALTDLARLACTDDGTHAEQAAVVAWWRTRADHPGTGAVLNVTDTCSTRWALGTAPNHDRDLSTWAGWLHPGQALPATTPSERTALALKLAATVTAGQTLPGLLDVHRSDTASWDYLVKRIAAGWDWRTSDSRAEAALGLATRCDAAELYASLRLRDPLTAHAATYDGTTVQGVVTSLGARPGGAKTGTDLTVTATRALCRLRTGSAVEGWAGTALDSPALGRDSAGRYLRAATIDQASIDTDGALHLILTDVVTRGDRFTVGEPITLRAKAADPRAQTNGRQNLHHRYRSSTNWLNRRTAPTIRRRTVPLDVVIAAAED